MNILAQPAAPPSGGGWTAVGAQRLVLHNVPWQSYVAIGDALPDRPALRMTYDRGNLEFMTTSPEHEKYKVRLGRLLEALVEECGLQVEPLGNMTMRREELEPRPGAGRVLLHRQRAAHARPAGLGTRSATRRRTLSSRSRSAAAPSTAWASTPLSACRKSGAATAPRCGRTCCNRTARGWRPRPARRFRRFRWRGSCRSCNRARRWVTST